MKNEEIKYYKDDPILEVLQCLRGMADKDKKEE